MKRNKQLLSQYIAAGTYDTEVIVDLINQAIQDPRGGHTSISLTGMPVREQISTVQKSRMTPNSNPKK